jgi:hypothetical protein
MVHSLPVSGSHVRWFRHGKILGLRQRTCSGTVVASTCGAAIILYREGCEALAISDAVLASAVVDDDPRLGEADQGIRVYGL